MKILAIIALLPSLAFSQVTTKVTIDGSNQSSSVQFYFNGNPTTLYSYSGGTVSMAPLPALTLPISDAETGGRHLERFISRTEFDLGLQKSYPETLTNRIRRVPNGKLKWRFECGNLLNEITYDPATNSNTNEPRAQADVSWACFSEWSRALKNFIYEIGHAF